MLAKVDNPDFVIKATYRLGLIDMQEHKYKSAIEKLLLVEETNDKFM